MYDKDLSFQTRRGVSLLGLMFWLMIIGFMSLITIKTFPSINEYVIIQRTVSQIAHSDFSTVQEIRGAFDKQKEIEYSIQSISGKDLEVFKENDRVVVSFRYDAEVELYGPVSLLIHFTGKSK